MFLIPVGVYCVVVLTASLVLSRTDWGLGARSHYVHPSVAVVIAARDEEDNLSSCLAALTLQEGQFKELVLVVVDDHSVDDTAAIAETFAANDPRIMVASTPSNQGGKASALAHGIRQVDTDIIVTTDADCTPPRDWLNGLVALLRQTGYDAVCGPTMVVTESYKDRIQALDWLLLFGLAGAFSAAGLPITAMGNNMAVRREAYVKAGGYERFTETATEDYAFFRAVNQLEGGRARVILLPEAVNYTRPESGLAAAFRQRKRWALGGLAAPWWVRLLYAVVWGAHSGVIAVGAIDPARALLPMLAILTADALLLMSMGRTTDAGVPWADIPSFEICKFAYVVLMPLSLLIQPRVTWKGDRY